MPAAAPWLDTASPPQYAYYQGNQPVNDPATQGADSGALQQGTSWLQGLFQSVGSVIGVNSNNSQVDTTLHWKLSGTVIVALLIVFGLSAGGFRFVSSANVNLGR